MTENKAAAHVYSLRKLERGDAPRMLEWMHDANVMRYLRLNGAGTTEADALNFIEAAQSEQQDLHRAIVDETNTYFGTVSLKNIKNGEAEYAIVLRSDAMGTGAAQAATKLIWTYGFQELGLKRIYLNVLAENERAICFYRRIGFSPAGETEIGFKGILRKLLWYEKQNETL